MMCDLCDVNGSMGFCLKVCSNRTFHRFGILRLPRLDQGGAGRASPC